MNNRSKILLMLLIVAQFACSYEENTTGIDTVERPTEELVMNEEEALLTSDKEMQNLFDNRISDTQVMIQGEVIKNLADDNEGSRHQKFIVKLISKQTILVSHNIDLADRIDDLQEGDEVMIHGEYEWNDRGGVIHWTHHDPDGHHIGGWIKHNGSLYE